MTVRTVLTTAALSGGLLIASASLVWAAGSPTLCGFKGGDPAHGKVIFEQTCSACHGADGHGVIPGTPDFTQKGGVLSKPHSALADHIHNGFSPPGAAMAMPPRGGNPDLTDQDIKDVHAYLHQAFGCG